MGGVRKKIFSPLPNCRDQVWSGGEGSACRSKGWVRFGIWAGNVLNSFD